MRLGRGASRSSRTREQIDGRVHRLEAGRRYAPVSRANSTGALSRWTTAPARCSTAPTEAAIFQTVWLITASPRVVRAPENAPDRLGQDATADCPDHAGQQLQAAVQRGAKVTDAGAVLAGDGAPERPEPLAAILGCGADGLPGTVRQAQLGDRSDHGPDDPLPHPDRSRRRDRHQGDAGLCPRLGHHRHPAGPPWQVGQEHSDVRVRAAQLEQPGPAFLIGLQPLAAGLYLPRPVVSDGAGPAAPEGHRPGMREDRDRPATPP